MDDRLFQGLLKRVGQGDKGAFEELYKRVYPRIYRYLYRLLGDGEMAKDLGNEVMMEVWKGARAFRQEAKVSTWIWSIARRKVWRELRKERGEMVGLEEWDGTDGRDVPHQVAQARDIRERVNQALERLSLNHREVIHMAYYQGLSLAEMAEILDIPVNTVKTRMFYARKRLGEVLRLMGVTGYEV